jgi:predicted amidophosphoribosyltransferase
MVYDNGHWRVWSEDPKCIETFEATRCQAEEEIFTSYMPGVTYQQFMKRWQELLSQNKDKILSEITAKEMKMALSPEASDMFRTALNEILRMKF